MRPRRAVKYLVRDSAGEEQLLSVFGKRGRIITLTPADLASHLHIGRTTLMTAFKHYTGSTLGDYIINCRLKHAIAALRTGTTKQAAAELCGFGDACNLIRCFRRKFGMTPTQYIKEPNQT